MFDELLPIGSIVLVKDCEKRIMIEGIKQISDDGTVYDYCGVFYPEGYISDEYRFVFNRDDVTFVFFQGFVDIEHTLYREKVREKLKEKNLEY